jgi:hypothetical protein
MSRNVVSRRQFLTLWLFSLFAPPWPTQAVAAVRRGVLGVDVALLYRAISLGLSGTVVETVDQKAGRYELSASGNGRGLASRFQSRGIARAGRWAPVHSSSWFRVAGRESHTEVVYDYERRQALYKFRGETFFLRRVREANDVVPIPDGTHLDDMTSALLNYADGRWRTGHDGAYHTSVMRRRRPEDEGLDDVQESYRAEIIPLVLRVSRDAATEKSTAVFDLSPFSSWARSGWPARVVFGPDRRPQAISASLILGTSVDIRIERSA